jgi:hypothetical protein
MMLRTVSFLALVLTALALIPYGAHLFALPNKLGMTQEQYLTAQMAYRGWSALAVILIPAMLLNIAFASVLRGAGSAFVLAVAACVCMAATLAIFFAWTYPANVQTQNWAVAPADWEELRRQWEYSHAVNAVLMFLTFCLVALAVLSALGPARRDTSLHTLTRTSDELAARMKRISEPPHWQAYDSMPLFDLRFLTEFPASGLGTSNRRH